MTQRRDFLRQASMIAAGTLAASRLEAQGTTAAGTPAAGPAVPRAPGDWDMSWTARVTGKHRMVFDVPEIAEGVSLHHARSFLSGYAETLGLTDADLSAVLVVRHAAVPMVLEDALWADGAYAESTKLKDPESGEPAKRNPFIRIPAGARHSLTWPDGALDTLMGRGVIVLVCDLALNNAIGGVARRKEITRQAARDLVHQHLLPGVTRMPSGVFATCHAQSLGCGLLASA
jgi:hypothetical protein